MQGLVSAGQSVANFFEGLFPEGAGSDQTKGVPLEGKDGQGDVTTKSIEAPEEGIEVDGLVGLIKSKKPLSGKSMLFARGGKKEIMDITNKAIEATKATDIIRKAVGHTKKGFGAVKELSNKPGKVDTLYHGLNDFGGGTKTITFPKKTTTLSKN